MPTPLRCALHLRSSAIHPAARRIAVLGSMKELGDFAPGFPRPLVEPLCRGQRRFRHPRWPRDASRSRANWGKGRTIRLASLSALPIAKDRARLSPRSRNSAWSAATRFSSRVRIPWDWRGWSPTSPPGKARRSRMLYLLAQWLDFEGLFNLVRYQTFRSGATLLTALALGLMIGPEVHFDAARAPGQGPADPRRRPADAPRQGRHADDGRADDPHLAARSRCCCGWTSRARSCGPAWRSPAALG